MPFKNISYPEHWFCSAERNNLCSFGRRHYEEHFCEIILTLDQWFRGCRLRDFLSTALAVLFVEPSVQFW